MLIIGGKEVHIDDQILISTFGRSYERVGQLGEWIAALIEDDSNHPFTSIDDMCREFLSMNINNPLPIRFVHPSFNSTVITMTGNRRNDEQAANANLGLVATPEGYTWHHCEGIKPYKNKWRCRMILIQSRYHNRTPHRGGVQEYKRITNTGYQ